MKTLQINRFALVVIGALLVSISATSCKKTVTPKQEKGIHIVDQRLVGKWMWTNSSDGAYFDNNGVYQGSAYGLAKQFNIGADGYGTCFSHLYSTIGAGTYIEVNISSQGFFESDNQGHLGYFPTSGTYKSTSGENRALRSDELWNTETNSGKSDLVQKLVFKTVGGRECFQVTATNGTVDTFFKVP